MLTIERLKELFEYNPDTGIFTNRISRGRAREACRAGIQDVHGYRRIVIDYCKYYEHHLAWFWVYGVWPEETDHRDGDRANNAIANLREATRTQNNFNSERGTGQSGLRGAYLDHRVSRWYSKIQVGGQVKWLGHFDTAEEAHAAFLVAAETAHGKFAYHNRTTQLEAI